MQLSLHPKKDDPGILIQWMQTPEERHDNVERGPEQKLLDDKGTEDQLEVQNKGA